MSVSKLLVVGIIVIAAAFRLWSLFPPPDEAKSWPFTEDEWLAPSQSGQEQLPPISSRQWSFDFVVTETRMAALIEKTGGELKPGEAIAQTFEAMFRDLPGELDRDSMERIALLFEKSFPGAEGERLSRWFVSLFHYHQARAKALQHIEAENETGSLAFARAALQASQRLQQEYLGAVLADQFYGRQNALSAYLLERRQIRESGSLSAEQKAAALQSLRPPGQLEP